MQDARAKSLIHFHIIVFIFGFTSILGALISIDAIPLVWYRMVIATLSLAIFFNFFNKTYFRLPRHLIKGVVLAGLIIAVHWITFFQAIKIAGVSLTLSMMSTGAFITAILEPLFFNRKFFLYEFVFGGFAALGVLLIFDAEFQYLNGILIALISAFLSVIFTLINGKIVHKAEPITLSFYELLVGAIGITLYMIFSNQFEWVQFKLVPYDILWLLVLGIVCTAYAFNASIKVMKNLSPFTVMMIINMEPVYGILLSLVIFGEKEFMSLNYYLGLAIVLTAILFNGIFKHRKQRKEKVL